MENRKKSIGLFEATKWMYSFIKVYKKWLLTGAAASGLLIIVNILKAYYTQEIIDNALGGRYGELFKIIGVFVLITLAGVVSEYMSRYATGRYALYATRDMKEKLARHITRVTMGSIHESKMGDLATRLNNNVERITNFMKNDFLFIALYPVMGLAAVIYILFINWKLLLVSVAPIPFLMLAAGYLSKKMGELFPKCYELLGRAGARVEEAFLGIDIIKSYNLEGRVHRGARDIYMDNYKTEFKVYRYLAPMQAVGLSTAWLSRLICALFGGYMALRGEIHVGTLVAVIQLLEYVAFPTAGFAWILGTLRGAKAAIERVNVVFNMPMEQEDGCEVMKSNSEVVIEFKDAGFGYEDSKKVISNLSFKLKRGKTAALVGASGSGKSTVINLICRLYEYNEGRIELYGKDIRELSIRLIRDSIAVVSQDAFLFPGSIAENILQGRKNASMEEVIEASKAAHAHEFIMGMPEGYQTKLGESGVNLSGGQRQRLSIARAFLKDAPILLLDEPTSSLDNHSEALIQESLERLMLGRTVLMVAHRLSTITKADNIMVMNDGSIIEHGIHEELINKMSYYSQLYNNQLLLSKEEEELKYA